MSNNLDITIHDFDNICRTCLSRDDLKPLYGKYLVDMLMACTFVKFREGDGLPVKICTNCITEIGQAISFANRCEATDTILRKCVKKFETELANNSLQSQKDDLIIEIDSDEPANESYAEDVDEDQDETNSEKSHDRGTNSRRSSTNSQIKEDGAKDEDGPSHFSKVKPKLPYYECKKCFEKFSDFKVLKKHREAKHPPNSFSQKSNLGQRSEPNDQKYQCQSCDKSFRRIALLKTHQKMHTEEEKDESYEEDFADESYEEDVGEDQDRTYIEKSGNPGSKRRSINSQIQEESLDKRLNLLKIRKRRKKKGERLFACHVCEKAFKLKAHLKVHNRVHTGEKPYVCSVCSKAFAHNLSLNNHMRIHTGEKPYICEVCNRGFSQHTARLNHMRLHTGEKPYTCRVCSNAFRNSSNLKRHMRTHTREKPYACEVCSKAFNSNGNLKVHMRIHTGEKPYTCRVCSKAFSHANTLKYHLGIHT